MNGVVEYEFICEANKSSNECSKIEDYGIGTSSVRYECYVNVSNKILEQLTAYVYLGLMCSCICRIDC